MISVEYLRSDEQLVVESFVVPNPVSVEKQQFSRGFHSEGHLLIKDAPRSCFAEIIFPVEFVESDVLQIKNLHSMGVQLAAK